MQNSHKQILIGTRIPYNLKTMLSKYCLSHGIKMNYFITEAIKEKLLEIAEDEQDAAIVEKRMKNPKYISQKEFNKYLAKRGIKL